MPSLKDYDLYIFDWDGTLSTSTILIRISRFLNKGYMPRHVMSHKEEYNFFAKNMKREEEESWLYALLYDIYSVFFPQRLKQDAIEVLKLLKKRGKKVAIFSDSEKYRLAKETKLLGVLDHVDFVLSAGSIGYYKPNPTGLLLVVDKFKAKKERSIYVGDMASDMITAEFAGITGCALADGLSPYNSLKSTNPRYIFKDLSKMISALKK